MRRMTNDDCCGSVYLYLDVGFVIGLMGLFDGFDDMVFLICNLLMAAIVVMYNNSHVGGAY